MPLWTVRLLASAVLSASLVLGSAAEAYVLKKDSTGEVVRWATRVEFTMDPALAAKLGQDKGPSAVRAAFSHIEGSAGVPVSVKEGAVGTPGYDFDLGDDNKNEIFAPDEWDYEPNMIAVTLVTLNTRTHAIIDADILFNIVHRNFIVVDESAQGGARLAQGDDVQNTFTHELGHALGLAHNPDLLDAVMYPGARKGETNKRRLSSDDVAGLSELYPQAVRQNMSELSGSTQGSNSDGGDVMGCSSSGGDFAVMALFALAPLAFGLRRRTAVPVVARRTVARHAARSVFAVLALSAVALVSVGALPAFASDVTRAPADAALAQVVASGKVVDARTLAPVKGQRMLFTELTLQVSTCHKGNCPSQLTVRVPGGRHGEVEQHIEGLEVPAVGEQVGTTVLPGRNGGTQARVYRLGELKDLAAFVQGLQDAGLPFYAVSPASAAPSGSVGVTR